MVPVASLLASGAALAAGAGPNGINIGFDFNWNSGPAGYTASFVASTNSSGSTLNNCGGAVNASTSSCDFAFAYSIGGASQTQVTSGGVYELYPNYPTQSPFCDTNPSNSAPLTLWNCFNNNSFGQVFKASASGTLSNFRIPMTCLNPAGTQLTGLRAVLYQVNPNGTSIPATPLAVTPVDLSTCPTMTSWANYQFSAGDFAQITLPFSGVTLTSGNFYAIYFAGPVVPGTQLVPFPTHDFNGDGRSDLLFRDSNTGTVADWLMNGVAIESMVSLGTIASNWQIVGTCGFYGDGTSDVLLRDGNSGTVAIWRMSGGSLATATSVGVLPSNWSVVGTGDFNGDGYCDILLRDSNSGTVGIWEMQGAQILAALSIGTLPSNWQILGTGDFNGDGKSDVLLQDSSSGTVGIWEMNGAQILAALSIGTLPSNWKIFGTGDFNGDGKSDVLLQDSNSGTVGIWEMNGAQVLAALSVAALPSNWQIVETGDFNGDGKSDILLRDNNSGTVGIWEMNGAQILAALSISGLASNWQIQSLNSN